MLDYALVLGMTVEQYWYGNPRLLLNYEKKYKMESDKKRQEAWLIGAYVKSALQSTILVAGLADTGKKMPEYPDMPMPTNDDGEFEMTERQKELERERLYRYYKQLAKINNKKGV